MEDLCDICASLRVDEDEEDVVFAVEESKLENAKQSMGDLIHERLMCDRDFNRWALKSFMGGLWNTHGNIDMRDLDDGGFCCNFERIDDKKK